MRTDAASATETRRSDRAGKSKAPAARHGFGKDWPQQVERPARRRTSPQRGPGTASTAQLPAQRLERLAQRVEKFQSRLRSIKADLQAAKPGAKRPAKHKD